jgi:hypothetical protein
MKEVMTNINLRGISMTEFYELTEKIAELIDEYLNTEMEDLSNINDLVQKEINVAYHTQQKENVEINGGSK